jgi:dipeptidyl aminopeptidase/acylaminoacyl peptidase
MKMRFAILMIPVWLLAKDPIVTTDMLKIRNVTDVKVAPDGTFAVYSVLSMHTEPAADGKGDPAYSYRTHLFYVDLNDASAKPVQLTFGDRNDGGIALSPDGRTLAFTRMETSGKERHVQVWTMPVRGTGEAQVITHLENGATAPRWRSDGKALLVSSSIPISKIEGKPGFELERPQREWFDWDKKANGNPDGDRKAVREWLAHNAAKANPTEITRMNFLGELGLNGEITLSELYVVDLENKKATQITKDFRNHGQAAFSPDGSQIVFTSTPDVSTNPDRLKRASVWMINADGSNEHLLLDDKAYSYQGAQFTKDGKALVVAVTQADQPGYRQTKLERYDLGSKKLTALATNWESGIQRFDLASDGSVLFTSPWHGGEPLERASLDGGAAADLTKGPTGVAAFGEGGGKLVVALISVANPQELYLVGKDGSMRQLTELNSRWLANKAISIPEEHWITRPDGKKVQYWVMNPTNAQAGKKYPWTLEIHGGPTAMWGPGEFSMWHEFQMLCAWGYGVVYSNPRGSGGYGYEFQRANFKNWGDAPAGDVLAAFDESVKSNPLADRDRLFITGGSYAGYLTAWIIGHDQRFKAAVAERGVYDLATFYGEGNAYGLVEGDFGGFPWEPETKKLLDHESPFTYVENIKTPFLIIHGSSDNRTGVAQGEMLFKALKQMGRPVEYIRYPNIGHELTRSGPPNQRMDHTLRIIEFFERYSGNTRAESQ